MLMAHSGFRPTWVLALFAPFKALLLLWELLPLWGRVTERAGDVYLVELLSGCCPKDLFAPSTQDWLASLRVTLRKTKTSVMSHILCRVTGWDPKAIWTEAELCACIYICPHQANRRAMYVLLLITAGSLAQLRRLFSIVVNWPCRNPKALESVQLPKHKAFALCFWGVLR